MIRNMTGWMLASLAVLLANLALAGDGVSAIDNVMKKYVENGVFNGAVSVTKAGKIIYQKGFGAANREWDTPNGPHTKFRIASLTKSFTSVLVMMLVEEGKLELTDTLDQFLLQMPVETAQKITIHHLLTHTSGLPNYFEIPGWFSGEFKRDLAEDEFLETVANLELKFLPGTNSSYSNSGFYILGQVIQEVTGTSYSEALHIRVLGPLHLVNTGPDKHTTVLGNRASGYQWASGGGYRNQNYLNMDLFRATGDLYSTVADISVWENALHTGQLISDKSLEMMLDPETGFGWDVEELELSPDLPPLETVTYNGQIEGFSSMITAFKADRYAIVLLSNTPIGFYAKQGLTAEIAATIYGSPQQAQQLPVSFILTRGLSEGRLPGAMEGCKNHTKIVEDDARRIYELSQQMDRAGLTEPAALVRKFLTNSLAGRE